MPHRIILVIAYCFFIVKCLIKTASIHDHWFVRGRVSPPRWWTYDMMHKHTHKERWKSVQRRSHGQKDASIRCVCLRPPHGPTETQGWINGCVQMGKGEGGRRDWKRRCGGCWEGGGGGMSPRAAGSYVVVTMKQSVLLQVCECACISVCTIEHCLY